MTTGSTVLTMPPRGGGDVCPACRSWRRADFRVCWNCQTAMDRLGVVAPVVAVSLYAKPSELREWVTHYKSSRGDVVEVYAESLRRVVTDFLVAYGSVIRQDFGPFDYATPVPSAVSEDAVSRLFEPSSRLLAPLRSTLNFASGSAAKPGAYDPAWYAVTDNVQGDRVVVVDDVYTSGARAQSAAAALRERGADVGLILVVARRINPGFAPEARRLWQRQVALGYDLSARPYWR